MKLVQRLYDVDAGRVTIDSQDVGHATQASLRRQVAIVPQEPVLFHRTLAENIGYGSADATQTEIEEEARLANAHDFIVALPKGNRTPVGERRVKLSGGERQRVAIARAFLADAPILILDEATSSLDSRVRGGDPAGDGAADGEPHRDRHCAPVVDGACARLDPRLLGGRIVEDGTHDALLGTGDGHYRRLFERQAGTAAPVIVMDQMDQTADR